MKKPVILIFFRKLLTLVLLVAGVYAEDCKLQKRYREPSEDGYRGAVNFKRTQTYLGLGFLFYRYIIFLVY